MWNIIIQNLVMKYIFMRHIIYFKSLINGYIKEINNEILIPKINVIEISDVKAKITRGFNYSL